MVWGWLFALWVYWLLFRGLLAVLFGLWRLMLWSWYDIGWVWCRGGFGFLGVSAVSGDSWLRLCCLVIMWLDVADVS